MKKPFCLFLVLLVLVSQLCLFLYCPTYKAFATGTPGTSYYASSVLYPTSDATPNQWTGSSGGNHYVLIDDNATTTDYIYMTGTTTLTDMYGMADVNPTSPTIFNVTIYAFASRSVGAATFKLLVLSGSTWSNTTKSIGTSYAWVSQTYTTDPATSAAWKMSAVNALKCGVSGSKSVDYIYVASLYVLVWYGYTLETPLAHHELLYVDGFDATWNNCTNGGSSPYLDNADSPANYFNMSVAGDGADKGWFSFQNTTFNNTIFFSVPEVLLEVLLYSDSAGYWNWTVSDGSSTTVYNDVGYTQEWTWRTYNLTTFITTAAKVNDCKLKFERAQYATNAIVDCARLNITIDDALSSDNILDVCSYNSTETNWVGQGTSPYLDPSMDNYFTYSTTNGNASWFSFENTVQSPQQVFFELQGYTGSGIQISPYINNGSATTQLSARILVGTITTWFEWNVTNILSTTTTINAAILKLQYLNTTGSNMYIYTARLRLYSHCYPYSSLVTVSDSKTYSNAIFSCYWYDSVALNVGTLTHNAGGSYVNVTTALSGTLAWSNFTVTLPATTGDITYWFTTNDTSGNEERTSNNFTLPVIWNQTTTFTKINVNTATTAHTLGRKAITGNGRIWIGYPVLVGAIYQLWCNSSVDGITWISAGMIRDNIDVISTGFWYMSESCDSSVWHIHVHWCNETATISPVEYRRGILNSNGTITWETDWQTAVPAQSGRNLAVNGITTTPNGTTYMEYTSRTSGLDISIYLTKNSLQNGTWSTAPDYPLNLTSSNFYSMEGYPYALNDTTVYCFMTSKMGGVDGKIMGRYVVDNALSTLENITVLYETEGRDFSTAIDGVGNLHLAYASGGGLYYCRWNMTLQAWDVTDDLFGAGSNFPAVSVNTMNNVPYVYVNWVSGPSDVYCNIRNSTAWAYSAGTRILSLSPYNLTSQIDPNTIPQNSTTYVTFILSVTNCTDAQDQLWTLTYPFPYALDLFANATQSFSLGLGIAKAIELLRGFSQAIVISLQTSRLAEWFMAVTQSISMLFVGIRLAELAKTASLTILLSLVGSRLTDITRPVSQNVGFTIATSRLAEFTRTASETFSLGFVGVSIEDFFRSVSQAISAALNAQRLIEVSRSVSQTVALALQGVGEKIAIYLVDAVLAISTSFQASRLAEWFKTLNQTIALALQGTRLSELWKTASQTIATSLSMTRLLEATRTASETLIFVFVGSKLAQFVRSATQTLNVGCVTAAITSFFRTASQSISAVLNGERLVELFRSASQTITLTLLGIGDKTGIYLRNVALTITTAIQGSRLAEWVKSASQTVSVAFGSTRLGEFARAASQTVALAFASVGEKLGNYIANVALTITTTLQTSRQAQWFRQAAQTLTLSLSTSRIAQFLALVVLTITTVFNADRLIELLRQASQTLSFVFNGERLIEVARAVSQTIVLTLEGFGEFVGNYFRDVVLNLGFTITALAEVPEATILLALAIALMVVACVVTYAVAKTQKKPEKD